MQAMSSRAVVAAAVSLALGLAGCAATPAKPIVAECPAPAPVVLPTRPALEIKMLAPEASCETTLKAYVASLNQCVGYAEELVTTVKPKPAKPFN